MTLEELLEERDRLQDDVEAGSRAILDALPDRFLGIAPTRLDAYEDTDTVSGLLMLAGLSLIFSTLPLAATSRVAQDIIELTTGRRPSSPPQTRVIGYLNARVLSATARIQETVQRSRMLGDEPERVLEAIRNTLESLTRNLHTDILTAMSSWEREVQASAHEEGDLFVYEGPLDDRIRPFCRDVKSKGRAYTLAEVEELNSHPLLSAQVPPHVRTLCGGYNCRHMFMLVSEEYARNNGYALD